MICNTTLPEALAHTRFAVHMSALATILMSVGSCGDADGSTVCPSQYARI